MSNRCGNFDSCMRKEMENMRYPLDKRSLYVNRLYDKQTAARRCYERNPINIVEGFGQWDASWNNIIKWVVVILLIILFIILAKDFFMPKEEVSIGTGSVSEFENPTLSIQK